MAALGHKQSFISLASDRLVPARSSHRELVQSAGIDRIFFGII